MIDVDSPQFPEYQDDKLQFIVYRQEAFGPPSRTHLTFYVGITYLEVIELVGLNHGGGRYFVKVIDDETGQFLGSKVFDIAGKPKAFNNISGQLTPDQIDSALREIQQGTRQSNARVTQDAGHTTITRNYLTDNIPMTKVPSAEEILKITQAVEERAKEAARLQEEQRQAKLNKFREQGALLARSNISSIVASILAQAQVGRYAFTVVQTSEDTTDESHAFLSGYLETIGDEFRAKGYRIAQHYLRSVDPKLPGRGLHYELQVTITWSKD